MIESTGIHLWAGIRLNLLAGAGGQHGWASRTQWISASEWSERLSQKKGCWSPVPRSRAGGGKVTYRGRVDPGRLVFINETWTKADMGTLRG